MSAEYPQHPRCAVDACQPCQCAVVFASYEQQWQNIRAVERHQGDMRYGARNELRERMVRDWINHKLGRCFV